MERKLDVVHYDDSLAKCIQELFIKKIVPANFLLAVHKHDGNVLANLDISRLRKKLEREPDEEVNMDLLHLIIKYAGWFECILKVLSDPEIKQEHLVKFFRELKEQHDLKWNQEHPKDDEIPPVTEPIVSQATDNEIPPVTEPIVSQATVNETPPVTETIVSQATDNAISERYARDVPSTESNGVLEQSVLNISLCSDSVGFFASSGIHENMLRPNTDGTEQCHALDLGLMTHQSVDQHQSATDLQSTETNGSLDESAITRSDPVEDLANLSESKEWSMTNGKGYCYVCNIELTSEQHKNQHLAGKGHKRKLERNSLDGRNELDTTAAEDDEVESKDINFCHVCEIALTSPENAKQHYEGRNHRKKVDALKKRAATSRDVSFSEGSVSMDDDEDGEETERNNSKFCFDCSLALTSAEHAKQHYEGKNHRKKVESLKTKPAVDYTSLPGDNEIYSLDSSGKGCCKVCDVVFTSIQTAHEHLKGRSHEKKVESK